MARLLVIGDTHCPGMRRGYVDFLQRVAETHDVDRVVHIGDLVDWASISFHEKSPALHNAEREFDYRLARDLGLPVVYVAPEELESELEPPALAELRRASREGCVWGSRCWAKSGDCGSHRTWRTAATATSRANAARKSASPSNLRGEERLEVLLHELVHAAGWHLGESIVEQFANDAARALWRLGYRDVEPSLDHAI
jgi:hypothetical protein